MAELILVHGVGEILKKVISMATPEIGLLWNVKDELEKLVRTLAAIQAVLLDAEKHPEEKEIVRLILRRLRDVTYTAEDVLDEFGYQTTRLDVTNKSPSTFAATLTASLSLLRHLRRHSWPYHCDSEPHQSLESLTVMALPLTGGILLSVSALRAATWLVLSQLFTLNLLRHLLISDRQRFFDRIEILHIHQSLDLEAIVTPIKKDVEVLPSSLESLQVKDCPSQTSLPDLRSLHSIREFYFVNNEKVTRLPEGLHTLRTLEFMSIGGFSSELKSFPNLEPLQHFPSLSELHIIGWSKLASLPEHLQSLTQLQVLVIHTFHSVTVLPEWLGNLSSLQHLNLKECNKLIYLPKEEGRRCWLIIKSCPLLKKRCTRGRSEEYPN
ncbi:hypothetical protein NE237_003274 [Protea cynaroides]|uniref:Disease resistance N-terminal domain-containing protein n=1 Tax=Protea cynaroides TaxID=273540 RepID=A0A9Q0KGS4_9MAGN|nr:hypothetical protein NE237_003274 [Protea cynaroides]